MEIEAGRIGRLRVDMLRAFAGALEVGLRIDLLGNFGELGRLVDAAHAYLQERLKARLERLGWLVRVEVSFNVYGDRGRYDLLAFHPPTGILLVVEIKTVLGDLQGLLGGLDVKLRVAPAVARREGWRVRAVVPLLLVQSETTNRRRVAEHPALFAPFTLRGRAAQRWLAEPHASASGLLSFSKVPYVVVGDANASRRRRVRRPTAGSRSRRGEDGADRSSSRS